LFCASASERALVANWTLCAVAGAVDGTLLRHANEGLRRSAARSPAPRAHSAIASLLPPLVEVSNGSLFV
jgi:hypothetical protein